MLNQSTSEARTNFAKQKAKYLNQLIRRLNNGEITQEYFDSQKWLAYQELDSAETAYVETLLVEVAKNATVNLDETVKTAGDYVAAGAGAVAGAAGKVAGNALNRAGAGLFGNVGIAGLVLALLALGIWAFGWGPLSKIKVKG